MSVQRTQSYKDARATDFHSSVEKRQVARNAPFAGTYNARLNVAAHASKKQLMPATRAATTASWVGAVMTLEVYDVEGTSKVDAVHNSFLLCDSESTETSSVMTDNDIDDECGGPASVCTTETTSPLQVFGHLRTHHFASAPLLERMTYAAGEEQEDDEMSVTTELEDDLTAAAVLLCKGANACTRQNSGIDDCDSTGILTSTSTIHSSTVSGNLDRFSEEKERPSRAQKGVTSWLNRHVTPDTADKEIPEEIC